MNGKWSMHIQAHSAAIQTMGLFKTNRYIFPYCLWLKHDKLKNEIFQRIAQERK